MKIDASKEFQKDLWLEAFDNSDGSLEIFERTAFSPKQSRCITIDNKTVSVLY